MKSNATSSKNYKNYVDPESGVKTTLTGTELDEAIKNGTVIRRDTFCKRQFVDAVFGETSELVGEALELAKRSGLVVPRSQFMREHLVDKRNGKRTTLTGEALRLALEQGVVVTRYIYDNKRYVDSITGENTNLSGEALQTAIKQKKVVTRTAFYQQYFVDVETQKRTNLTGSELRKAKKNFTVIHKSNYDHADDYVLASTGVRAGLSGVELAKARKNGDVVHKGSYNRIRVKQDSTKLTSPNSILMDDEDLDSLFAEPTSLPKKRSINSDNFDEECTISSEEPRQKKPSTRVQYDIEKSDGLGLIDLPAPIMSSKATKTSQLDDMMDLEATHHQKSSSSSDKASAKLQKIRSLPPLSNLEYCGFMAPRKVAMQLTKLNDNNAEHHTHMDMSGF